jgi:hypothetical protein
LVPSGSTRFRPNGALRASRFPWHDRQVDRWWLLLIAGCYQPAEIETCNTMCGTVVGQVCPPGQTCDDNGVCKPAGMQGNCLPPEAGLDAHEKIDAPADSFVAGQICFGSFFRTCLDSEPPVTPLVLDEPINTNLAASCTLLQPQANLPMVCVIAARDITIPMGQTVRVTGARPLALFATNTIVIAGTIDASSSHVGMRGAGGDTGVCQAAGIGAIATSGGGGGGGAGGSLTGGGGKGGNGVGGSPGGLLTPPALAGNLEHVRGGCPGARGGNSSNGAAGVGGSGGGALYFMAMNGLELTASAVINASGAAGSSADPRTGGGGGGSGGFIGFHSAAYTFAGGARIYAIGGGGSPGGGTSTKGAVGTEATGPNNTLTILGSDGGGAGGGGASGNGNSGTNGITGSSGGGGGGGGGGGMIGFVGQASVAATFAPPPGSL